ncbi:natriuretic and helokinestatin peptides-like [Elgaria multicarinata webbii]|uniref:natriuretic and helokinestatin peptides-like n=1 Tax=Elgaria multicarinata webbii TaxID=159646 RepID=UPI002FCD2665
MNFKLTCSGSLLLLLLFFTYDQGRANPLKRGQSLSKRFEDDSRELRQKRAAEENVPPLGPDVQKPRAEENLPPPYMPTVPRDVDENAPQLDLALARASEENFPPPIFPFEPRAESENVPPHQPLVPRTSVAKPPQFMPFIPKSSVAKPPPFVPLVPRDSDENPPQFVNYEPRSFDENALRKLIHKVRRSFWRSARRNKRLYPGDGCFGQKIERIGTVSGMGCGSSNSGYSGKK